MKIKKLKFNNKGFSLVEVLAGVMILVIIAVPMMRTFVSAARTASKSRENRNATMAVQNVVENLTMRSVTRLITDVTEVANTSRWGLGSEAEVNFYTSADGNYNEIDATTIKSGADEYYIGLKNIKSGKSNYDCMVKFDAMADEYKDTNQILLAKYTEMDGVYYQSSNVDDNPDTQAAAHFVNTATVLSGAAVPEDYFDDIMNRQIVITVEKTQDSLTTYTLSAKVEFIYSAKYGTETLQKQFTTEFYHNAYDGTNSDLESLYLFYFPMYTSRDTITIYNLNNVEFNMFLIKQKKSDTDNATLGALENAYKASVVVREATGTTATISCTKVSSNLNANLITKTAITPSSNFLFQLYKGVWYSNFTISGQLVATEAKNRIYKVEADLFEAGQGFAEEAHILTFEASSTKYN